MRFDTDPPFSDFSNANETTLVLLNTEIDIGYADVLGGGKRHRKKNHHKKRKKSKDRRNDIGRRDGDDEQRYHQSKISIVYEGHSRTNSLKKSADF